MTGGASWPDSPNQINPRAIVVHLLAVASALLILQERRRKTVRSLMKREEGQGLVEYGLIIFLVAIVVVAIIVLLGPRIGNVFSSITAAI